jgi:hypothetical protein
MSHLGDSGTPLGSDQLNGTKRNPTPRLTPDENDLAEGRDNLKEGKASPRPVALSVCEAIAD